MSNNLNLQIMTAAQNNKEITNNDQVGILDAALTEFNISDFTSGNVTLTDQQFRENMVHILDNVAVARVFDFTSADKHFFLVIGDTANTDTCTVTVGSSTVTVDADEVKMLYTDGTVNGLFEISAAALGGPFLALAGGTMAGVIAMGGNNITGGGVITGTTIEATGDTSAGDNAALGHTATEGLVLTGQGSTNDVTIKNDADADVIVVPTGTQNVIFSGDITLQTGDLILASGQGIDFSATADGSGTTTQELLDDYEEGSFIATIKIGGSDSGITYSQQVGNYTKIGRMVYYSIDIQTSSLNSLTGVVEILGFPFATSSIKGSANVAFAFGLAITAGESITLSTQADSTIDPFVWDSVSGTTRMTDVEWTDNGRLIFDGSYITAS